MANQPGIILSSGQPFKKGKMPKADDLQKMFEGMVKRISVGAGLELRSFNNQLIISLKESFRPVRVAVQRFQVVNQSDEYLLCKVKDLAGLGTSIFNIAKPYLLRRSSYQGKPARAGVTYTYVDAGKRTATDGTNTWTETIQPSYEIGDIIFAENCVAGGTDVVVAGEQLTWLDQNLDGRSFKGGSSGGTGIASVYCATTGNVSLLGPPGLIDGVSPPAGQKVLVWKQSNSLENAVYTPATTAGQAWVKTSPAPDAVAVLFGTQNQRRLFLNQGAATGWVTALSQWG